MYMVCVSYLSEGQLVGGCSHVLRGGIEEPGPCRTQQLNSDAPGFLLLQISTNHAQNHAWPYKRVLGNLSQSLDLQQPHQVYVAQTGGPFVLVQVYYSNEDRSTSYKFR